MACGEPQDDRPPTPNLGDGDYRVSISDRVDGKITSSELSFDAPSSWQSTGSHFLGDTIVIGDLGWRLVDGQWQVIDGAAVAKLLNIQSLGFKSELPAGVRRSAGPRIDGEETSRWTFVSTTAGTKLASGMIRAASRNPLIDEALLKEIYDDAAALEGVSATFEYVIGNDSGRVFEVRSTTSDERRIPSQTYTITYEPVTIVAP